MYIISSFRKHQTRKYEDIEDIEDIFDFHFSYHKNIYHKYFFLSEIYFQIILSLFSLSHVKQGSRLGLC